MNRPGWLTVAFCLSPGLACGQSRPEYLTHDSFIYTDPVFSPDGRRVRSYYIMGTLLELEAVGPEAALDEAIDAAYREVERVDAAMSLYRPESELSRLNRLGPESPHGLSRDTFAVLEAALGMASASGGAFDPTVGPLVKLWSAGHVPALRDLRAALDKVGYRRVVLDRTERTVSFGAAGVLVDLNGIAKGYAVDRALAALRLAGVREAWVSLGESSLGSYGAPRQVALRDLLRPDRIAASFQLTAGTVSTSGGYEKGFQQQGRWYSHLIDPRTGWPLQRSVSATVVAGEGQAMLADALSTAGIVLGPQEALRLWERLGVEGIFFYQSGDRLDSRRTSGFPLR